jgi:NAD(P)H-dependent FMN reductase
MSDLKNGIEPQRVLVAGLSGSLRAGSYTASAVRIALEGAQEFGAQISFLDLHDYDLGLHLGQAEACRQRGDVRRFRADVKAADGLIIGTPEYHGSFSGVLKNAMDFLTFDEMEGKMIGLVGVSGGNMGAFDAMNGLRSVGRALHAWVVPQQAAIPEAWKVFDDSGHIHVPDLEKRIVEVGRQVARFAQLHKQGSTFEFLRNWETAPANPGGEG